jgi:Protein of unknown function (DUF3015)
MRSFMKNMLYISIVAAFCFLAARANAIGSAGCGLGSVVFKGNEWWKQTLAATTNDLTFSQTLGITTGTSNCAPGLFGDAQKQEDYMVANLTSIQREAAQGSGEVLNGLASVLGCDNSSFAGFGAYTQEKYSDIFNSQDTKQILVNLKSEIQKNSSLSNSCKLTNI